MLVYAAQMQRRLHLHIDCGFPVGYGQSEVEGEARVCEAMEQWELVQRATGAWASKVNLTATSFSIFVDGY